MKKFIDKVTFLDIVSLFPLTIGVILTALTAGYIIRTSLMAIPAALAAYICFWMTLHAWKAAAAIREENESRIFLWMARDSNGDLYAYSSKPEYDSNTRTFYPTDIVNGDEDYIPVDKDRFQWISPCSEPRLVSFYFHG